jgi:hypothetical protein
MTVNSSRFRFRAVLPAAQFLLCLLAVFPFRGVVISDIRASFRAYFTKSNPSLPTDRTVTLPTPDSGIAMTSSRTKFMNFLLWTPEALNLPVMMLELPEAISSPDKNNWIPEGFSFHTWRQLRWPILGILFWWIAGRAIDAIFAARRSEIRPRISWIETGFALITAIFSVLFFIAIYIEGKPSDPEPVFLLLTCSAMWILLGLSTIVARIFQMRLRRRMKSTSQLVSL